MADSIGRDLGRYHILEQLGEGGMATVYKAYDTRLETEVAVKVIRTEDLPPKTMERALKRFEREAKALAKLNHANIVKVIDYGEYEGSPYLVMPYLSGGTLKHRLTGRPMSWQDAARILVPVARALDYAHRQGMIHRDVKPSNVLITEDGDPLLTDFGIAKIIDDDATMDLTGTSATVGTPEYMAPEQVTSRDVDHRADIYALGVVFYEMVTGRKPYTADTPMAVLFKHASEPLPRPAQFVRDLPEQVERVLLRALAKRPEDRYQSMEEFAAALEGLQGSLARGSVGIELPRSVRLQQNAGDTPDANRGPRRTKHPSSLLVVAGGVVVGGAILVLLVVGVVLLAIWRDRSDIVAPSQIAPSRTPTAMIARGLVTPARQPETGRRILWQDDFSNPNSGWPTAADTDKAASYTDGQYLMQAFTASQDVWAHPGEDFSDVSIEVDAAKHSGPDNNDFGIICRFVDDSNFYFLIVASDGYQVIGKYQNGDAVYLSSEQMEVTDAVLSGTATNHLRADCIGSTLTLYVNGQQVSSVTDTSFTSGDIGLTVGTFDEPNASVVFDNFVVYASQ